MNQNKTGRTFFACAIGAGIGTLVALQLGHFWGLGALFGGLVGYLVYDIEAVVAVIPEAYRRTVNWTPDKKYWRDFVLYTLANTTTILTVLIGFMVVVAIVGVTIQPRFIIQNSREIKITFVMLGSVLAAINLLVCVNYFLDPQVSISDEHQWEVIRDINPFKIYIYWPICFLCWVTPKIPKGIAMAVSAVGKVMAKIPSMLMAALKAVWQFVKTVFIMIHSDSRLLCGIDSLVGASAGYFAGSVLIGALSGGVLGVLHYELVSRLWLGLEKAE